MYSLQIKEVHNYDTNFSVQELAAYSGTILLLTHN